MGHEVDVISKHFVKQEGLETLRFIRTRTTDFTFRVREKKK